MFHFIYLFFADKKKLIYISCILSLFSIIILYLLNCYLILSVLTTRTKNTRIRLIRSTPLQIFRTWDGLSRLLLELGSRLLLGLGSRGFFSSRALGFFSGWALAASSRVGLSASSRVRLSASSPHGWVCVPARRSDAKVRYSFMFIR